MASLKANLKVGANIIVNTNVNHQYCANNIPCLTQPIIWQQTEIVIDERQIWKTKHFSQTKKLLHKLGSQVVRIASNRNIPDAPVGSRTFSRKAAMYLMYLILILIPQKQLFKQGKLNNKGCYINIQNKFNYELHNRDQPIQAITTILDKP